MKRIIFLQFFVLIFSGLNVVAQNATLSGKITEKGTKEALYGVNIIINSSKNTDNIGIQRGTVSDINGNYSLELPPGHYDISFNFIGFAEVSKTVNLKGFENHELNIALSQSAQIISEVVVSAGRYEQNLSEVTVSMEVIKPKMIENTNAFNIESAINQIPGVDVSDEQPSIRASSGWSYGAGSRVMILMDDLPIMSGDAGDVKWNYIPIENVSQVEVVKGASSVLFGSSAIGGVINVRSAYPTSKPKTKISYFSGVYDSPEDERLIWWEREFFTGNDSKFKIPFREEFFYWVKNPMYGGLSFSHAQQFDNLDLSLGGNHFIQEGYRFFDFEKRSRFNANVRYRAEKIKGLALGINTNFMALDKSDFFLWDSDTTAFLPNLDMIEAIIPMQGYRVNLDPYANYIASNGDKYSLKTRFFSVTNDYPSDTSKNAIAHTYYTEGQYQTKIKNIYNLTTGVVFAYSDVQSNLYKDHFSRNLALYAQSDANYGKLKLTFGLRGEYFIVDTAQTESMIDINLGKDTIAIPIKPVFGAGANYKLFEYTFLRASLGQGYRFPSIAEKYTATSLGMVRILPNPEITAETSWSSEFGIKQGFKLGEWVGFLDLAFFIQDIDNLMEYTFGVFNPVTFKPYQEGDTVSAVMGFQAQNVGDARILGNEIGVSTNGKIGPFNATIMAGYTYTYPTSKGAIDTTTSSLSPLLKYRNKHTIKSDFDFEADKLTFGFNIIYKSPVENVDRLFCDERDPETVIEEVYNTYKMFSSFILPGYWDYRLENADKSSIMIDARVGFKFSEYLRVSFIVKNVFNEMYVGRPGDMQPPRRFEIQLSANF